MNLDNSIKLKIESHLQDQVISLNPVGGGCISDSQILRCKSGKNYFLKVNSNAGDMFIKEANGLRELKKANTIHVPEIIFVNNDFILLENIIPGKRAKNFFEDFGRRFADLHRFTSVNFGFYENNYIGSNPQVNTPPGDNWKNFYWEKRILFQLKLAEQNGFSSEELRKSVSKLEDRLDLILEGSENFASLLHGDMWSGNFIADENGVVCIIDPAVYYGNREADLAMTNLFGGFNSGFYSSYEEHFPLPDGYEFRINFYKLYHVMNHLNLFGSGYYQQVISLIKFYF